MGETFVLPPNTITTGSRIAICWKSRSCGATTLTVSARPGPNRKARIHRKKLQAAWLATWKKERVEGPAFFFDYYRRERRVRVAYKDIIVFGEYGALRKACRRGRLTTVQPDAQT